MPKFIDRLRALIFRRSLSAAAYSKERDEVEFAAGNWDIAKEIVERLMSVAMTRGLFGRNDIAYVRIVAGSPFEGIEASGSAGIDLEKQDSVNRLVQRVAMAMNPRGAKFDGCCWERWAATAHEADLMKESAHYHLESERLLLERLEEIGIPRQRAEVLLADVR